MSKREKPISGDARTIRRLIRTEREVDKAELLGIRPVLKSRWPLTVGVGAIAALAGALLVTYLLTGTPGEPEVAVRRPAEAEETIATEDAEETVAMTREDAPVASDRDADEQAITVPPLADDPPAVVAPDPASTAPPADAPVTDTPTPDAPTPDAPTTSEPPALRDDAPRVTQPAVPRVRATPDRAPTPAEPAPAPTRQPSQPAPAPQPAPEPVPTPVPDPAPRQVQRTLTETVRIPGGTIRFGALPGDGAALGNEQPPIEVTVEPFLMEVHQVTNRQYKEFLDATGYTPVPMSDDPSVTQYDWDPETRTYPRGQDDFPVVNVSRDDAMAYADWAGRRLPTEIEWEAAARMGAENVLYPWGNSFPDRVFANFDAQGLVQVQQYGPTGPGLYDIAGNAFEWVADTYLADIHETFDAATYPPRGEGLGVLKGGAFYSTFREVRISYRENNSPSLRFFGYGFRLVADE